MYNVQSTAQFYTLDFRPILSIPSSHRRLQRGFESSYLNLKMIFFDSTSYTTAAYGSHQNVLLRLDTLGRPPSSTGSYATIASLHKFPFGEFLG